ncbi:hypothetical protein FRB90_008515, partial [Tulasnella sp. 427]
MDAYTSSQRDDAKAIMNESWEQLSRRLSVTEAHVSAQSCIDENIATLDEVLEDYTKSIKSLQFELRQRRNAIAPINQLPMEVLFHIFFFAFTLGGWDDWNIYTVIRLMTVCKAWRKAIKRESSLWCQIASYRRQWQNEMVLKHNPSGPLEVICTSEYWMQSTIPISNPSRWRSLRFKGTLGPDLSKALESADRLRHLVITLGPPPRKRVSVTPEYLEEEDDDDDENDDDENDENDDDEENGDGSRHSEILEYEDLPQIMVPKPANLLTLDLEYATIPWASVHGIQLEVLSLQGHCVFPPSPLAAGQ